MSFALHWLFYGILGVVPSAIWLDFYLKRDLHPEPKKAIIKTFIWGILFAPLAISLEFIAISFFRALPVTNSLKSILSIFIGTALVEEFVKYSVVRTKIIKDKVFDEPVDAMIYCIIAALGFAAIENVLVISFFDNTFDALTIIVLRFAGATFLHALAGGIIGYFLALEIWQKKKNTVLIGIGLATLLHGFYNWFIILPGRTKIVFIIILLISMAIAVSAGFKKLRDLDLSQEKN